jgi:hypothetical protein
MKLDREQSLKLDQLLTAFGNLDTLDRNHVLDIFGQDEQLACAMVQVLVNYGLVSELGRVEDHDLPMFLSKEPAALLFIRNEGFEKMYLEKARKAESDNQSAILSNRNLELQNENLAFQQTIREQEARIRAYDEQNKLAELLKNYWWILGIIYTLGVFTLKIIRLF